MVTFGYVIPSFGPFIDPGAFADLVGAGEELGFHDVWFGDHVVVPRYAAHITPPDWVDPLAACLLGLGQTSRLRFGTDILVAPYRHPALVAKMVASADRLAGGRLTLGVGIGWLRGEFAILGADFSARGRDTDEFCDIVRLLWESDGPVSFDGSRWSFTDAVFGPSPLQVPLPLWVGGNNAAALRRAARRGNGWHPLFPTPARYAEAKETIMALRHGNDAPFAFSYSCAVTTVLDAAPTDFATQTWDRLEDAPEDLSYAPPIPTAADGRPLFVGTPDLLGADIAAFVGAGVEHFTLRFVNGATGAGVDGLLAQMRRFTTEVAPRFA